MASTARVRSVTEDHLEYAPGPESTYPPVTDDPAAQLAELMIDHNVGVSLQHPYEVKRLDLDCFVDDEESSPPA
jgi:hypothetical protein